MQTLRGVLPLGGRAGVVGQVGLGGGAVGDVVVQICGQHIAGTIELGARGLVVTGQNHVGHFKRDTSQPLLPQIPVGLVKHTHIASLGTTLVRDFARRQRRFVLVRDGSSTWQLRASAIVADRPVILTGQDTRIPIVGVAICC